MEGESVCSNNAVALYAARRPHVAAVFNLTSRTSVYGVCRYRGDAGGVVCRCRGDAGNNYT